MRIYCCRKGLAYIRNILQKELPDDEVLECRPEQVAEVARQADILIPTVSPIGAAAFASPRLKLVQQYGAGLDSVDVPAATRAGVYVANVPSAGTGNAESVAELSLFFMLALARRYPQAQESIAQQKLGTPMGLTLKSRSAAIIGYGGIGHEVARRLAGFEMDSILAISKRGPKGTPEENAIPVDFHGRLDDLHAMLGRADFVVVAPPLNDETRGLIGPAEFAAMKPGAFLINVARGPVVDYNAFLAALKDGRLAGAGLDVFWHEPFDPTDPIFSYNVIATPHFGGATDLSLQGIGKKVAENVDRLRNGHAPLNCANPEVSGQR